MSYISLEYVDAFAPQIWLLSDSLTCLFVDDFDGAAVFVVGNFDLHLPTTCVEVDVDMAEFLYLV